MAPLSSIEKGETVRINSVEKEDGLSQKVGELGFHKGEKVTVISKSYGGMMARVKDTIYGIGKYITDRIDVEEIGNGQNR